MYNNEFKPQAYCCWSNLGGCQIEVNNTGEAVRYQIYDRPVSDWTEILYDIDGRAYFVSEFNNYKEKHYLNDFITYNI